MKGPESKPVTSKIENDTQIDKSPVKEVITTSANNIQKKVTIQKPAQAAQPALIAQSGDTGLRRGAKELSKVVEKMGMDPHNGDMYAFSNMKNSIKVLQEKSDGMLLIIKKNGGPIEDWPEYIPPGKPGHTVQLSGQKRQQFLKKMGFTVN
jgi:hypothetical protein